MNVGVGARGWKGVGVAVASEEGATNAIGFPVWKVPWIEFIKGVLHPERAITMIAVSTGIMRRFF